MGAYEELLARGFGSSVVPGYAEKAVEGLGAFASHQAKQEEESKPLSSFEKWAAMIATGQVDAHTASVAARMGYDPEHFAVPTGPAVDPTQVAPGGLGAVPMTPGPAMQMVPGPAAVTGGPPVPVVSPATVPAQGALGFNTPAYATARGGLGAPAEAQTGLTFPQTRKDYNAAMQVAPFITRRNISEEEATARKNIAELNARTKKEEGAANRGTKEEIATQNRDARVQMAADQITLGYAKLEQSESEFERKIKEARSETDKRIGADKEIAAIRVFQANLSSVEQSYASTIKALVDDGETGPALQKAVDNMAELQRKKREQDLRLQNLEKSHMGTEGGVRVPGSQPQATVPVGGGTATSARTSETSVVPAHQMTAAERRAEWEAIQRRRAEIAAQREAARKKKAAGGQ